MPREKEFEVEVTFTGYTYGVNTYVEKVRVFAPSARAAKMGIESSDIDISDRFSDCDTIEVATVLREIKSKGK